MPSRLLIVLLGLLGLACSSIPSAHTQDPTPPQNPDPSFTLHAGTRIVLTDVTVTDHHGNVIHGLPAPAFHVTDNKQPQHLASFEEHNDEPTAIKDVALPTTPGVYSNDFLLHLPHVLNILVIDTTNLGITSQMSCNIELTKFINELPADKPLAIYARTGDAAVLVQNFTADHALLRAAVAKAIPRLPYLGLDRQMSNSFQTLHQIALQLSQVPGRKNVLFFSGNLTPFEADPTSMIDPGALRSLYDELEQTRMAVYPIDAHGLTIGGNIQQLLDSEGVAEATGGHVVFARNSLALETDHILATDNSFYTLTYNPPNFVADNKWHKIKVTLDDPRYTLSYRRGYFADGFNLNSQPHSDQPRTLLLAGGKTAPLRADLRSSPIIFEASVLPASAPPPNPEETFTPLRSFALPKKGTTTYSIRYTVPADIFITQSIQGREHAHFDVAAVAFNQAGERIAGDATQVDLTFPQNNPHIPVKFEQQINLGKGDAYLFLAVWDTVTRRLGTLQIPLTIAPPAKP